jgi:hypothetical protein
LADFQAGAVVGDDFEFFDVVVGFAGHDGVDAAGIVADHAADGATGVAGGIGGKGEVKFFGGVAQAVEDDAGLDAGDAAHGVNLEDAGHVAGKIEHDGDVAALAGERGAAATTEDGSSELAAGGDCGEDIICIAGENHADGDLAVVGAVGRVEGAAAGVETHIAFAAKREAQSLGQTGSVGKRGLWVGCGIWGSIIHGGWHGAADFLVQLEDFLVTEAMANLEPSPSRWTLMVTIFPFRSLETMVQRF